MKFEKTVVLSFSPTGGTAKAVRLLAEGLAQPVEFLDVTAMAAEHDFQPGTLAVLAVPVYGGRVPEPALERIRACRGNGTPAVLAAVYGNREFEDALLELEETARNSGFVPVAGAALIAEHSIFRKVAAGRPDDKDAAAIADFAAAISARLEAAGDVGQIPAPEFPGNRPYRKFDGVPMKPKAGSACIRCGRCAAGCPVQAIPASAPDQTDTSKCITCMQCVRNCPTGARQLNKLMFVAAEAGFVAKNSTRKESKLYL